MKRTMTTDYPLIKQAGQIGRVQTMLCYPVYAGDSIRINAGGKLSLSDLRRGIKSDVQVTFAWFYIPHRHIWTNWEDFILEGVDEAQTLAAVAHTRDDVGIIDCHAWRHRDTSMFRPVVVGYNQIWNRYWRHLMFQSEKPVDTIPAAGDEAAYG